MSLAGLFCLVHDEAAVDVDGLTRDVARAWAGKENDQRIACHTVSAMPNFWVAQIGAFV